jgi:transcriptional regulator with XRE-family HTH domain
MPGIYTAVAADPGAPERWPDCILAASALENQPVRHLEHTGAVNDLRLGSAPRAIRVRRRLRQTDVAAAARVSPTIVGRIEHGRLETIPIGSLRRVAQAVDARVDLIARWQGGDLSRLINARHAAMHEAMAQAFAASSEWHAEPEVSFSIYGERGIIDILAWHPGTRSILVVELKTELVDVNELMGTLDRKRRLAAEIARQRSWQPNSVSTWVVLADSRTNRRALSIHETLLRTKFPDDGRRVRGWLHHPDAPMLALSFLPSIHAVKLGRDLQPIRRVTRARSARLRA